MAGINGRKVDVSDEVDERALLLLEIDVGEKEEDKVEFAEGLLVEGFGVGKGVSVAC